MDLHIHKAIAQKLDEGLSGGWLSDYLVAWHGPSGRLAPNVTVWCADGRTDDEVRAYLAVMLTGIVAAQDIEVADV